MDPGRAEYKAEMVAQTRRRMEKIPSFQGVVVDRSDYARFYNLEHDDGVTLTSAPGTQHSWSMKRSYLEVINGVRGVLGTSKVMLMNSLGYSSISFMRDIDGCVIYLQALYDCVHTRLSYYCGTCASLTARHVRISVPSVSATSRGFTHVARVPKMLLFFSSTF